MAEGNGAPVTGVVDASGRLTAADGALLRLQEEAGSELGRPLAVPQLASITRLARKLGVPISRSAVAGSGDEAIDLWVRAEPVGEAVRLIIDGWIRRPAQGPRWWGRGEAFGIAADGGSLDNGFVTDAELCVMEVGAALAHRLGCNEQPAVALTRLFRLESGEDGDMPLLAAAAMRTAFTGQRARVRGGDDDSLLFLSGDPLIGADSRFAGFSGRATSGDEGSEVPDRESSHMNELLRQPLDLIIGEAQAISALAEGPLRSDYAAYAGDIATAGRHLLDVLRAMGEEPHPIEDDRLDLVELAKDAAGLVQPQAAVRDVQIRTGGAAEVWARGQGRAVTQVLVNLIGNAVRYSPSGGEVRVTLTAGREASVTVGDSGPGVALADQARIFERFEQAEPRGEGAGLGLAISRRLAQSMGGDVTLDSLPGEGGRFRLSLPLA